MTKREAMFDGCSTGFLSRLLLSTLPLSEQDKETIRKILLNREPASNENHSN